ncbi:hypothetical protein Tco_0421454 [Tanacetum coccineum]
MEKEHICYSKMKNIASLGMMKLEMNKRKHNMKNGEISNRDIQVPSNYTSLEGIDMDTIDNRKVSYIESKNDLTIELENGSFKDKDELIRATKLYTILPSNYTSLEGINMDTIDNRKVSYIESKNDLTIELEKGSFKDKDELIRATKLYTIREHYVGKH